MNETAKTLKITQLDDQIRSGNSLTVGALAHHLNVDRKRASIIAKASGLAPECGKYSWLRIWRAIHGTEGAKFTIHLAKLQRLHPGSAILGEVKDLEAALRAPLINFDAMASHSKVGTFFNQGHGRYFYHQRCMNNFRMRWLSSLKNLIAWAGPSALCTSIGDRVERRCRRVWTVWRRVRGDSRALPLCATTPSVAGRPGGGRGVFVPGDVHRGGG
jgi:hypothetical protein